MSNVSFNNPTISTGTPFESTDVSKKEENKDPELSPEQKVHLKHESLKRTVRRVAITTGAVLLSPLILAGGGVLALSKMLCKENSLWDKAMSKAILPAASRKIKDTAKANNEGIRFEAEPKDKKSEIKGVVKLARMGNMPLEPSIAAKMPCVVLFCQNNAAMEDTNMQKQAKQFQEKGYNVVMFNYRGVGDSKGMVRKCDDLYQDGKAVVDKLIEKGFDIGNGVKLKPAEGNVILDGSSIGGAVAIHIGAERPQAVLVANRTFTSWTDAAEGLVAKFTNPLFAKMAKGILKQSKKRSEFDNVAKLEKRLSDSNHSITIIEHAGVTGDGVLTSKAKLTEAKLTKNCMKAKINKQLHEDRFINSNKNKVEDLHHHNSFIPLEERVNLSSIVESHLNSLQMLQNVIDLDRKINYLIGLIEPSPEMIKKRIKHVEEQITILDKIVASDSKINKDTLDAMIKMLDAAVSNLQTVKNVDVGQMITNVNDIKVMLEIQEIINST